MLRWNMHTWPSAWALLAAMILLLFGGVSCQSSAPCDRTPAPPESKAAEKDFLPERFPPAGSPAEGSMPDMAPPSEPAIPDPMELK